MFYFPKISTMVLRFTISAKLIRVISTPGSQIAEYTASFSPFNRHHRRVPLRVIHRNAFPEFCSKYYDIEICEHIIGFFAASTF